jgi:hypothetical protein
MTITPDTALVRNPTRTSGLATLREAEAEAADLERRIGAHTTLTPATATGLVEGADDALRDLRESLTLARDKIQAARAALKPIPANLPANTINANALRATPRTNRRALQTVCRLLAYNAELDLSRALNTYLQDPNEYRSITRHLLHQPGQIAYTPTSITVTLSQPNAPRVARALKLLTELPWVRRRPSYVGSPTAVDY